MEFVELDMLILLRQLPKLQQKSKKAEKKFNFIKITLNFGG